MKRFAIVALFLATGASARAAEERLPHGLTLLAGHVTDDAARGRLRAGLADPRPAVRAAAVRVINVSGVGELVPALMAALGTESDTMVASEMIRFLASLNRPQLDTAALDAARRLGEAVHAALADGLARRGTSAASHVPALRALGFKSASWSVFYELASSGAGELGPLGAAILKEGDATAWRAFLRASRRSGAALEGSLAVAGVGSDLAEIRAGTYWHLALVFDSKTPLDDALLAALGKAPEALTQTPADPPAALAFEVLERIRGRPRHSVLDALHAPGPSVRKGIPSDVVSTSQLAGVFDKAERKALSTALFLRDNGLDGWSSMPALRPARKEVRGLVRTADGFPPGYVPDVLAATGCEPSKSGGLLAGEVSFGADGRPRHVGLLPGSASKPCLEATRALLVSALAPLGIPTRDAAASLLLLPDRPEFLACLDEAARLPLDRPARVDTEEGQEGAGPRIQGPRKIRDVRPQYPDIAKNRLVQGAVLLEASVAPSGCISGVSLLRGVDGFLDLEALRAVSGWGYTPTLLDGKPIPITMTVTVNFRLH